MIRPSRNPRVVYELRPSLRVKMRFRSVGDSRVETNSQGFRDAEYALEKAPGTYRIVGIGDSLMFGWGVPQGRDYLGIAERRLNRDHPERSWEIINTAVPGYNTVMEVETLVSRGFVYQPDLVVIGYCGNDFDLPNFIWLDEPYLSLRTSLLARFVKDRLSRIRAAEATGFGMRAAPLNEAGGFEGDPGRVPSRYRDLVGWPAFAGALRRLRDEGQARGFRVALLVFWAGEDGNRPRVVEYAKEIGVSVIDAEPLVRSYMREHCIQRYEASEMVLSPQDAHPSVTTHRLVATAFERWMQDEGLASVPSAVPAAAD